MHLNPRQERFCFEYAKKPSAREAYLKAGYKPKTDAVADANACRLLKTEKVQARLAELTAEMRSEKIANAAEMQEILTRIARQEQQEEVIVIEDVGNGISEARIVTKRPSNQDAIKAISQLARMQGVADGGAAINIVVPVFGGEDNLED